MSDAFTGPAPATASLQFERAEFTEPQGQSCPLCSRPLRDCYYEVNGRVCCAACHERLVATHERRPGARGFLLATACGLGGAVAGSAIFFAVRALTGYEFGLISILVGVLVGGAVRWGSKGRGGWLYQSVAVLLTYLAIVSTYIPEIYKGLVERGKARAALSAVHTDVPAPTAADTAAATRPPASSAAPKPKVGLGEVLKWGLVAGSLLLVFAATVPFTGGIGILGLFIIGIGLYEAWKLNHRAALRVSGPHRLAAPTASP